MVFLFSINFNPQKKPKGKTLHKMINRLYTKTFTSHADATKF